ncbi:MULTISPECIES: hexose kinase [Bacillus]|uniref:hexose kinase n=1 Tax=Bacillus TaxID=1386 RepID=UPI0004978A25|nr:hexose kinase [Bacillus sonorensis]MBG9914707.1 tagatose-6-phosphate kinase [Bacillus sonorensis]MCY8023981.1 hexose kinase [Bacillus sonorensis]MCY8033190.1 hexose kinase [Bacillus sonorensis]MCY8269819.1 hexose kinase [Bacillus sonorensis]MCY8561781.1 hexose kinase [Bacillus sonorensis]
MLLAVTLNPSVDISYRLDDLKLDDVNRAAEVRKTAGGKGLNVARVAHLLGADVISTGVLGGSLGDYIERLLDQDGMKHQFLHTNQEARNCIAILHEQKQTEILESGPHLTKADQDRFLYHFRSLLQGISVITISGSIVSGFATHVYSQMIEIANEKQIPVLLDTSGETLKASLQNKRALPYLIKPNASELRQLLNRSIAINPSEWQEALSHPIFSDVPWVVVSKGADGAFARHQHNFYRVKIPKIQAVNPVGSGDATVAGLAKAIEMNLNDEGVLKYGMAAGLLNAMEAQTGYVDASKFDHYASLVEVQKE